ncbi:ATP-binding cassette domain-containing protein [Novosphingobium flavum]|uniref:ATP-binding cassette domain-containing protein n=2 Tax=Novosphingobium flavum TaxID=1778672 RepID=A0A7X1FP79_9SPHN|nr:ABC transporter transmembrane domain-containing protein [Novosphingobium flavum]MBC2664413.1 ATP-binding cassette domain-containing protein [Novosphingobium flavum]
MAAEPAESAPSAPDTAESPAPAAGGKPARSLGPLRMVWGLAAHYPRQVALALLALLASSSATIAIPMRFKAIVDQAFGPGAHMGDIAGAFQLMLVIVVILGLATATRFYCVSWLGERVVADLREKVQANLLRLPPSFFEANSPKEISSRMTSDTALIEVVVGTTVSIALRNMITGIGGTAYLFFLAPKLTLQLLVAIPLIVLPIVVFGRRLSKASRTSQDTIADIGASVTETLGAIRVVQSFNQEERETARFHATVDRTFQAARRRIAIRAVMTAVVTMLVFGSITGLLWQGAIGVATGQISGGTIAAFVVTGGLVAGAFGALTEVYGDLLRGAGAASRLNELLAERPAIAAPARPIALPEPARGQIAFDRVTFRYPTRPDQPALSEITLKVDPGETVAIVGPSGAGKSTIFQLAQRFYDPQGGTVRLDGVALPSADPDAVRRRIALVPQEAVLFAASARDNLRYGNWEASDEQIWQAARAANAEQFLRDLPEGLDTFLGDNGSRLSGGQRQRVAIARALLRDAPILLLDEATSALDSESERLVQDALDRLMASRTTLVIAHRLATVRQADRIVVMDKGRIVEQGTHEELSRLGGLYARLASLQFDDRLVAEV